MGNGVNGIGWGEHGQVQNTANTRTRRGLLICLSSSNGILVGLGKMSPLKGVHSKTLAEAKEQIKEIKNVFFNSEAEV